MSYLLDTNVISETVRKKPNKEVIDWLKKIPNEHVYISVLSIGEIRKGIEKLDNTKRKEELILWLETEVKEWFQDRILNIDVEVSDRWGRLLHAVKRPVPAVDSLIAATALRYDLRVVTRNEKDFKYSQLEVINPWSL